MWISVLAVFLVTVTCVLGHCSNSIKVEGVSGANGNGLVNGEYIKIIDHGNADACDSRDVFNHTTNDVYLYHIGDVTGYWLFRDHFTCGGTDDDAYVRAHDAELNPGLVQVGWEEKKGSSWIRDNAISVDCYEVPRCRYYLTGAFNTKFNGYYDTFGDYECEFRDIHKHETEEAYLYFIWSNYNNEYYWVINKDYCKDTVYNGAYMFNDDYSISPELILDDWIEKNNNSAYVINNDLDIDCFGGATKPGIYMSMLLACVVFWSAV